MDTFIIGAIVTYLVIRVILRLMGIDPCGGGCCLPSRKPPQE